MLLVMVVVMAGAVLMVDLTVVLAVFVAAPAPFGAVFAAAPVPFVAESMADLDSGFIPAARISVGHTTIRCLADITPIRAISIRTRSMGALIRQARLPRREPQFGITVTTPRATTLM